MPMKKEKPASDTIRQHSRGLGKVDIWIHCISEKQINPCRMASPAKQQWKSKAPDPAPPQSDLNQSHQTQKTQDLPAKQQNTPTVCPFLALKLNCSYLSKTEQSAANKKEEEAKKPDEDDQKKKEEIDKVGISLQCLMLHVAYANPHFLDAGEERAEEHESSSAESEASYGRSAERTGLECEEEQCLHQANQAGRHGGEQGLAVHGTVTD